jgi:membrane-bound lytic murein transglycosylase D
MKWRLFLILPAVILLGEHGHGTTIESSGHPCLVASLRLEGPLSFCGETVPTEEQEVRERYEKELLLALGNRAQVILWLKRSSRYLPFIEKSIVEWQMPDDLKYVAFAESALLPHAGSSKGAVGYWQFIPSTGRKYGLTINARVDERRNVFSSTQAALRYFRELRDTFGSWTLAAAAYNMGENRLMAEISEQGTNNYYHLHLPLETQRFIFRILAVKVILRIPGNTASTLKTRTIIYPRPLM